MCCIWQRNFNFLLNLNTWAISDIEKAASKSLKVHASNLDIDFPSEVVHFVFHLRSSPDLGSKTNTAQAQLSYFEKELLNWNFSKCVYYSLYISDLACCKYGR